MSKRTKNIKQETALPPLPGTGGGAGYSPLPKKEGGDEVEKKHTKIAIHTVSQFYGDNIQLSLFSDEKIDAFKDATGLNLTNRPTNYGVVLNLAQRKVFEGILKAFTDTNYKGDEQKDKATALREVYPDTETSAKTLVKGENAPYRNIDTIPVVKLTQAQIIELSGYPIFLTVCIVLFAILSAFGFALLISSLANITNLLVI